MTAVAYRRALVIGLGQSGRAVAELLRSQGTTVVGYDARPLAQLALEQDIVHELFAGADEPPAAAFAEIDVMVLSPGVPPQRARELCALHAPKAAIHGELGLSLALLPRSRRVLITGTNGKSTVTALLGHLLATAGRRVFVGGNLGEPPAKLAREVLAGKTTAPEDLVIECSSYQLETLPKPAVDVEIAMVLNVTPDHLDRYTSLEHYALTKARVLDAAGASGLCLLDRADSWTAKLGKRAQQLAMIGDRGVATIEGDAGPGTTLWIGSDSYARAELKLPGRHNSLNALFALKAAQHLGVSREACLRGLQTFEGLPHRMAFVRELDGVGFYNDSKATNVASALASLGGLAERFVLIAGGRSKGDPLAPLGDLLAARGRGLVVVGESAEAFAALAGELPLARATDMHDAAHKARALAKPGDLVVLAPACASFDQYRSYAQRGESFANAVLKMR